MTVFDRSKYEGVIITGDKGSGKSVLGEVITERFYNDGRLILDLFDAGEFESCFWAIPFKKSYPLVVVYPPSNLMDTSRCEYDIKPMCDTEGLEKIIQVAIEEKRIITLAGALYELDDLLFVLSEWLRQLKDLLRDEFPKTECLVFIREAANVVFSKYKITENQTYTQKALLSFLRVARHIRTSYIFDTQRYEDLYAGHIYHFPKRIIKKTTNLSPYLLQYNELINQVYPAAKVLKKRLPNIQYLRRNEFYLGYGNVVPNYPLLHTNPMPSFHHKKPEDNFLQLTNIKVTKTDFARNTEFLNKRQVVELEYLRKFAIALGTKIFQKSLIFEGRPLSFTKIAKEIGVATSTISKYKKD